MDELNQPTKRSKINPQLWSREKDKKIFRFSKKIFKALQWLGVALIILMLLTAAIITIMGEVLYVMDDYDEYYEDEYYDDYGYEEDYPLSFSEMDCNVAGIEFYGTLVTYIANENLDESGYPFVDQASSQFITTSIVDAEESNNIKAIILEIDSYGGFPVAAEEVANALRNTKKPTVVFIREGAVSAAYWAATGADTIFASRNSDVGSIGVTMSYLDYSDQNARDGIKYISLSSGKFKDSGDPDRPLTAEEQELFMRDVNILHDNFVKVVSDYRGLDIEKVRAIADGSTVLGQTALELGLIDKIGGFYDVKDYLKELLNEEVEVCW